VLELHGLIARSIVLYYTLLGVWGVILAVRKTEFGSAYRGALIIGVVIGVVQAAVGLYLLVTGHQPANDLHYLYGASVIVTLPLVASYIADKKFSRLWAYALASLFMAGLAIRAITTGA
jgi:surface polysaccharide O-acyltransferase-like enzyme